MLRARVWGLSRQIIAQLNDHPSCHIKRRTQKFCSNVSLPIERLDNRTIVRVSGNDAMDYLQGLITNDMRHLKEGTDNIEGKIHHLKGMYCMFLDARGRILLDSIIYRSLSKNKSNDSIEVYYLECDSEIAPSLVKHLKLYKLRKKVDIAMIDDEMEVWVEFSPDSPRSKTLKSSFIGEKDSSNVLSCRDPRFPALGVRILSQKGNSSIIEDKKLHVLEPGHYRAFRYALGVGEGIQDLPPGNSFPLEANCDYLHGVSFHKGCYVGQELTARTYHTGVVRKRLMPVELSCKEVSNLSLQPDASVVDVKSGKPVGKLRGTTNFGDKYLGLGLLRVAEVLKAADLKVGDSEVKTGKPFWWPEEAPKSVRPKVVAA